MGEYKRRRALVSLPYWILFMVISLPLQAESTPEAMLQQMTDNVLAEIRKDPARLTDIRHVRALADKHVLPHIDFSAVAQWVLGKHWRHANHQQRVRFVEEFREMLLNTYLRTVNNYSDNVIRIIPARTAPSSGRAVVNAEIERPGGPPVHLGFRLHNPGDAWLVYDISVEGVSLVASHRSSFSREISEHGLDGLIARLEKMNATGDSEAAVGKVPTQPLN